MLYLRCCYLELQTCHLAYTLRGRQIRVMSISTHGSKKVPRLHAGALSGKPVWPDCGEPPTHPVITQPSPFRYFKTSPEVIRLAVMLYVRFPLSLRNVEDLLRERGIDICHETVRQW